MEKLKLWLIALVVTAFLAAAAERITPEGGVKKILRFASGLLLLLALLRPLTGELTAELPSLRRFQSETERLREEYTAENRSRMETLISEKTNSYIETRAAEQGLCLQAETHFQWSGEVPELKSVVLRGKQNAGFANAVAYELGINEGCICWEEGDE